MNGRNRHNKYRNGVYRRHNIGIIVLISTVTLALIIAAFLIVGNLLHTQSENREKDRAETDTTAPADSSEAQTKVPAKSITGHSVLLETDDTTFFSDRLDALTEAGVLDASVPLNKKDGTLLFKSTVAEDIGYPIGSSNITLEAAASTAKERNIYISGIFYVNAFSAEDPLLRSVELSKSAALIAEALTSGIDDVVIIAPHMTDAHVEEAIRFVNSIKALTDSGAVGLALTDSILALENSQSTLEIIDRLDSEIDFLAIDCSGLEDATQLGDKLKNEQPNLLRYKMRVLIPYTSDANGQTAIISAVEDYGIKNFQIIQ